jgi:hypothetical protein
MDAHEWYRRQMVEVREYEIERDQSRARMGRDARKASVGSRIRSSLRSIARRLLSARRDTERPVTADLASVVEQHDPFLTR